jgi:integrase
LTLAGARELATRELRRIELGADPAAERRTTTVARGRDTVAGLAEQFLDLHAKKRRPATYSQYRTILRNDVIPAWGGRSVHDIGRRDAIELVESMARERPVMANRALATLSKFFGWLVVRDVLKSSPCVGIERPATERPRERVLTDAEVAAIWTACDQLGYPYGPCIQMLILTGQRRGEVAGMRWEEVGGDTWSIGADRMKARQAHVVPLSRQALGILESVPRIEGGFVFTAAGKRGLAKFSQVSPRLCALLNPPLAPWVLHDIRRTMASGLQRLGFQIPIIEKILAHRSGTFRGIVATYQRHEYIAERREALQRWADHVEAIAR